MEETDSIFDPEYIQGTQTESSAQESSSGSTEENELDFSRKIELDYKSAKPRRVLISAKISES
jgi:hypothetical protein